MVGPARLVLLTGTLIALAGCAGTGSSNPAHGVGAGLSQATDTAALVLRPPQRIAQVAYREEPAFDQALNSAMRAETPRITVVFAPPIFERTSLATPDRASAASRLHRWLHEVEARGGRVAVCFEPPLDTRRGLGLLIWLAVGALAEVVHDAVLYGPAGDYDVELVVARDSDLVERAVFVRRDGPVDLRCAPEAPGV